MKFATFDIEAYKWVNLKTIGLYDGDLYSLFRDVNSFLDEILTSKYRSYKFYAHFGGGYDFKFLLPELIKRDFSISILDKNSRIMSITLRKGKNKWEFCDSYYMIPQGQAKIAKAFGVRHQKKEVDFEKLKESDFNKKEMLDRLKYDTVGLYEIITKYQTWGLNKGKLKSTLASQSLYIFKTHYLKQKLYGLDEQDESFIRKGYFGGRVEIFKMEGKELNYYDANSLYPSVMLEPMPCGRGVYCSSYRSDRIGFYYATVNIPVETIIPFIPVLIHNKLFFPVGTFNCYITNNEIELLNQYGFEYKILKGLYFTDQQPLFKQYILGMYNIKRGSKPDTLDYLMSKLHMNSLYGKFAQKREQEVIVIPDNYNEIKEKNLIPYHEDLGIYKQEKLSKSRYILPYLSSYITSLARRKLQEKIEEIGFDNIYYCDTDSIITSKKIKTGDNLGEWKKEYSKIQHAIFLQPKSYALKLDNGKEIIKVKGMPNKDLKFSDFKKALYDGDLSIIQSKYYKIAGFKESLNKFKDTGIHRIKVTKQLNNFYDKRKICRNFSTRPFLINDLTDK